ncbi:aminoacyl-tRNA hydrolase [Clostridium sp. YIM B02505]|uniref:peptidyl-tRNA hydrolase n=1 Tax=Clostridium yunnanense TaxID=2800325 RepID=A0ABS1EU25_9CLOT|nr:aminoacyl-tRNA hydrolase [Clostridium yunnanense]MBK1812803.1 aminoacyl-tRNA hydrolase [Clostridium yunnanense]
MDRRTKQVIVMRKDLQMTKGKMIAQGSHASLGMILEMMEVSNIINEEGNTSKAGAYSLNLKVEDNSAIDNWFKEGFKKVCVYVNSEDELIDIYNKAEEKGLPVLMIEDAGVTMFKGVPTKTCLAIGPAWDKDIDEVTGDLKLL